MIRRSFALVPALSLAMFAPAVVAHAQVGVPPTYNTDEQPRFSANQLDNLVGPIALYPDALLAQVLVASTFPDQIDDAARFVRANGTSGIDDQAWDVSVKAVAHYPSALNMMADKDDWTATLGRAYANQSSEVMAAVQRMRSMAAQQGNLVSTQQQQVLNDGGNYTIVPTQPRVIYVPVYDPYVIYTRPVFGVGLTGSYWSFGVGFPIGGWLNYDLDWRVRSVYYNGWNDAYFEYAGGWRARSRPFIQITNVYVSPRYRTVYVNRDVWRRPVDYRNVDRIVVGVHRDTYFDNHRTVGLTDRNRNRGDDYRGNDRVNDRGNDRNSDRYNDRGSNRTPERRTAEPRERPAATPDGYRGGDRTPVQRDPRPQVSAPEARRNEPVTRAPEIVRTAPPRNETRNEPRPEQRREQPAAQPRSAPRPEQPRTSPQRDGGGDRRTAVPRGDRGGDGGGRDRRGG